MAKERLSAMDIGDLRRRIREADQAGDRQKQVELLRQLCEHEVNDLRSRQRLGHLLKDFGYDAEATRELQRCASGYATEGFLNRAIQIVKTLVEFNPGDQVALRALQGLYARRQSSSPSVVADPQGLSRRPLTLSPQAKITRRSRSSGVNRPIPTCRFRPDSALFVQDERRSSKRLSRSGISATWSQAPWSLRTNPAMRMVKVARLRCPCSVRCPSERRRRSSRPWSRTALRAASTCFTKVRRTRSCGCSAAGGWRSGDAPAMKSRCWRAKGHGAVLGEMSIFDDSPRSASAITLGKVSAYSMTRQHLEKIWAQYPMVHKTLLKNYRLRHLRNLVAYALHAVHPRGSPPRRRYAVSGAGGACGGGLDWWR